MIKNLLLFVAPRPAAAALLAHVTAVLPILVRLEVYPQWTVSSEMAFSVAVSVRWEWAG